MKSKCNKSAIWKLSNAALCVCLCVCTCAGTRAISNSKLELLSGLGWGAGTPNHDFHFIPHLSLASSFLPVAYLSHCSVKVFR